jgi:arylsulfatase A-like enzyme
MPIRTRPPTSLAPVRRGPAPWSLNGAMSRSARGSGATSSYASVLPNDKTPLAMTLKLDGYSTARFGKCHEVPVWERAPWDPSINGPRGKRIVLFDYDASRAGAVPKRLLEGHRGTLMTDGY